MKLSLTIAGNTLRLLAVNGRQVAGWNSVLFNPAFLRQEQVANVEALAKVVRLALDAKRWRTRRVLAAIPNFGCQTTVLALPAAREVKPAEVIPREARRLLGIAEERDYLFWQPLAPKRNYFLVSTPRDSLANLVQMLRLAGLKPHRIDTHALALARAINQKDAVIASGESNEATVIIVRDFVPVVVRSHFLGDTPQPGETVADQLLEVLEHTLAYYNETHPDDHLVSAVPLFLCGAATLEVEADLVSNAERRTGLQVQSPENPFKTPPDFPLPQFMANLGLIMKEW